MQALSMMQRVLGVDNAAYLLIFVGNCFWILSLMYCAENKKIDFASMNRWRGLATTLINAILCRFYLESWAFSLKDIFKLNIRNTLSSIQGMTMAFGMHYLTGPVMHTISNSGPIIVFVMDYFRNGKTITRRQLYGIIVTSVGLLATVNASLIMYWLGFSENIDSHYSYIESSAFIKTGIALLVFVSIIGWAYGIILTKELTRTSTLQINLNLGIISCLIGGVLSFVEIPSVLPATTVNNPMTWMEQLDAFFYVGVFMCMSSIFYIGGVKTTTKTGQATIVGFSGTVTGYLISIFRYDETPSFIGISGSIMIFAGLVLVLLK